MKIIIGIEASRNRSGGARAHIIGIINSFNESLLEGRIKEIHVWSYSDLLNQLPDKHWLIKHDVKVSTKPILHQLWWQYKKLPIELSNNKVDILLNTDASSVCKYKPSITMSRDMLSYEDGEMRRFGISMQRLRLIALKYVQNYSLKKSTAAIFLTKYAADTIQKSTGKIGSVRIIPHGVSDNFRIPTNNGIWEENNKHIKCIYVSNVEFYKHHWNVAVAISNLRTKGYDISIDFVGGGAGKAQKKYEKIVSQINNNNLFIKQHEFIPHNKIPFLYSDKDIIIFASSCENMPNTLIEGMCTGLPIACSNKGPMPEVLRDAGVYFDPENINSIETSIQKIIEDSHLRSTISRESKELSKQYSWTRCSYETFTFLSEVCDIYKKVSK